MQRDFEDNLKHYSAIQNNLVNWFNKKKLTLLRIIIQKYLIIRIKIN